MTFSFALVISYAVLNIISTALLSLPVIDYALEYQFYLSVYTYMENSNIDFTIQG